MTSLSDRNEGNSKLQKLLNTISCHKDYLQTIVDSNTTSKHLFMHDRFPWVRGSLIGFSWKSLPVWIWAWRWDNGHEIGICGGWCILSHESTFRRGKEKLCELLKLVYIGVRDALFGPSSLPPCPISRLGGLFWARTMAAGVMRGLAEPAILECRLSIGCRDLFGVEKCLSGLMTSRVHCGLGGVWLG